MSDLTELLGRLDRDEVSILRDMASIEGWRFVSIHRSGGGQWMREARQRLKRKGLLETHPDRRRVWRATPEGRALLKAMATLHRDEGGE